MTMADKLASFVVRAAFQDLSETAKNQLKIRVLDSLGCALGAIEGEPVRIVKAQIQEFGGSDQCTLVGGGRTAPDRAAFYNSALVRYLDFNDSYLAKGESCHPSDNVAPILAASEYAGISGKDFLVALAVAYQVQCRLSDVAPVRARGFDHTTQGSFAVAAGVSRALGLDAERAVNAIAIAGTAFNALRVTRTGSLSNWKGLAYPNTAFSCTHAAFLAMRGITGPREVFEGNKGFMEAISGPFEIDWDREGLDRVNDTILKKYNAEIHSQSCIDAILDLRERHRFAPGDVRRIDIEIFDVAYHIIGGGEEGEKTTVRTKEEADHSLPYIVSVALADRQVMPEQYEAERIQRPAVQELLRKVVVRPNEAFSQRFPQEMPCLMTVYLDSGEILSVEKRDYEGFRTNPMRWQTVVDKFETLSRKHTTSNLRREISDAVSNLESIQIRDLMQLLEKVRK